MNSSNGTYVNGQRIKQYSLKQRRSIADGQHADALYRSKRRDPEKIWPRAVDIGQPKDQDEGSRIVHAVSQEEGSRIFDSQGRNAAELLAGPGPQQPANNVPHGPGRQSHA